MSSYEQSLVEGIETIVKKVVSDTPYTSSYVGKVASLKGLDCEVEVSGRPMKCYLLEHLSGQVSVGDVVVVQDLFNNGSNKYVLSKIGSAK